MFGKSKKEKKPKSKVRKIIDWVVTGVFATLIVGLAVIQIINKTTNNQNIFGSQYQRVLTDSMSPVYKVNDIISVRKANPENICERVNNGENVDVSFYWEVNGQTVSMTHRLVKVTDYGSVITDPITGEEYRYTFKAHGINTQSEFCKIGGEYGDCTNQYQEFHEDSLIGRVTGKSYFMTFATSIWGLLILLLVPCMYLIVASVFDIFKALDDKDEEASEPQIGTKDDPLSGLSEKEKEKLKKQMLDEMLGKSKKE